MSAGRGRGPGRPAGVRGAPTDRRRPAVGELAAASAARVLLLLLACATAGCAAGGQLTIRSEADPETELESGFDWSIYRFDGHGNLTMLLLDGPADAPRQAVTIRMLWLPRIARTPLDPAATNASIRYIRFDGAEVGIYSGAGYCHPKNRLGAAALAASVWEADLRLTRATEGFHDTLGPIRLHGNFTARRNDPQMALSLRQLSVLVSRRLNSAQFVRADRDADTMPGATAGLTAAGSCP